MTFVKGSLLWHCNSKDGKHPKCPLVGDCSSFVVHSYSEIPCIHKKKEAPLCVRMCSDLQDTLLSEKKWGDAECICYHLCENYMHIIIYIKHLWKDVTASGERI